MSVFLKSLILITRRYIILSQGCKLNFSKPMWMDKNGGGMGGGAGMCAVSARGGDRTAPTSEPKIVVVNST